MKDLFFGNWVIWVIALLGTNHIATQGMFEDENFFSRLVGYVYVLVSLEGKFLLAPFCWSFLFFLGGIHQDLFDVF